MANRLSHSQVNRFQDCPKSYEYHYIKKIRPKTTSSALLFGSALDVAFSQVLVQTGPKTPEEIFLDSWTNQNISDVPTYLPTSTNIVYSQNEFETYLLTEDDQKLIKAKYSIKDLDAEIESLEHSRTQYGFNNLPDEVQELYNHIAWLCLYRKGLILLEGARKKIKPKITKVLAIQKEVNLQNENGDSILGFVDLVCEWEGYDKPIVFDLKTSSKDYDDNSVLVSPQLSLYVHCLSEQYKTRYAGYIVLNKNLLRNKTKVCKVCNHNGSSSRAKTCDNVNESNGKRCNGEWDTKMTPEAMVQVLIDEIPEQTEQIVLENYDLINKSIKNGIFHRNFSNCVKYNGKVVCPYYNLCYKGDKKGLIKKEDQISIQSFGNLYLMLKKILGLSLIASGIITSPQQSLDGRTAIAIIDTGITANINYNKLCSHSKDFTKTSLLDKDGHGSNVAGIIEKDVDFKTHCLLILKIDTTPKTYVKALEYAVASKAKFINISLVGRHPIVYEIELLRQALHQGSLISVAAGNESTNLSKDCSFYPACYTFYSENYFIVASVNKKGEISSYSNFGGPANVYFVGEKLVGNGIVMSGTSQATASWTNTLILRESGK